MTVAPIDLPVDDDSARRVKRGERKMESGLWRTKKRLTSRWATLAAMVRHALAGDSEGFADLLDGFVRADRHDGLYHSTRHAAALLSGRSV